jgi:hypothetical protein
MRSPCVLPFEVAKQRWFIQAIQTPVRSERTTGLQRPQTSTVKKIGMFPSSGLCPVSSTVSDRWSVQVASIIQAMCILTNTKISSYIVGTYSPDQRDAWIRYSQPGAAPSRSGAPLHGEKSRHSTIKQRWLFLSNIHVNHCRGTR